MGEAGAEPIPIGHVLTPYVDLGRYRAHAVFDSAWPVKGGEEGQVVVRATASRPVVVSVPVGKGQVVLIGDTLFAANRNLENDAGLHLDRVRENAAF